jgi:lysophospholipase L1-like esterase
LGLSAGPWNKINLIGDLFVDDEKTSKDSTEAVLKKGVQEKGADSANNMSRSFELYRYGNTITKFRTDSTEPALALFLQKLHELRLGKKRKVRIAYFGDSMIEGDLLTQTLRKLLQQAFGGSGVGFVPIHSVSAKFRETAKTSTTGAWRELTFRDKSKNLSFAGHLFFGENAVFNCRNQVISDSGRALEKAFICGSPEHESFISYNNTRVSIKPKDKFQRILLSVDRQQEFSIRVEDPGIPVYGVSMESDSGVVLDNFSFRGITGIELGGIDTGMLAAINRENPYDLIVIQYGVNLLFRPYDKDFSWYGRSMMPILEKFKQHFNQADILIVSTADRAFRYDGVFKSAQGIDSLVATQAHIAYQLDVSFFNLFSTMGGQNSIVDWANQNPSLANRDYVHPNHRGAELLGIRLFQSIEKDYQKYVLSLPGNKSIK